MKILCGLVLFFSFVSAWAQQAPFCAVTGSGAQCHYYSLSACRQAVSGMDGACIANAVQSNPIQIQPVQAPRQIYDVNSAIQKPDMTASFQRGQTEGQRLRLERERHQAEMAYIAAQTEALKAKRQQTNDGYWVMYKCPDENGNLQPSGVPAPGCIVDFVTAY